MLNDDILNKKIALVVGCGGLGGYVIEQLARCGVGKLIIMDGDVFDESNLNRQLMSTKANMGSFKAHICKNRVESISDTAVLAIKEMFNEYNADLIDKVDIVVDCVDNIKTRLLLNKECDKRNKILVHGAVEGYYGNIMLCYPNKNNLAKLFVNKNEVAHSTNSYSVATIASLQTNLVVKALLGVGERYNNILFAINLEDLTINKLEIL